jgi:CRP-like cAMP-binding protein
MDPISLRHASTRLAQQQGASAAQKKRLQGEEARYTMIFHHARKQLGISIHEYCLSDTVNKLSGNRSHVPGWCYASKEHLGGVLGVSRRSIHNMINSLKKKNIVEVQEGTGYLRTTEVWRETVEVLRDKIFS